MAKRIYIFISAVLIFLSVSSYAKDYSFEEALSRALSVDENILAAEKELEKAHAEKGAAFGLYLPRVGVKGSYNFINGPITLDLNPIRDVISALHGGVALPDFTAQLQDDRFFKAELYASMPVFAGGKIIAANLAAKAGIAESLAKLDTVKNKLLVETSDKYFLALLTREVVKVRQGYLANAKEFADNSDKLFKSGSISKVEKMSADISYYQAKRDYDTSVNEADLAVTVLKNLLYESGDIGFTSQLFALKQADVQALEYFKQAALKNNTGLKILDAKKEMTNASVRAETATFMPNIYIFGSKELYEKDLTALDPKYIYGLGLEWNIFEGLRGINKTKAAKRQRESVSLVREKQLREINSAVEFFHKRISNSIFKYVSVQEEIIYAREVLKTRQLSFSAGTSTSLEVNFARTQLLKAELDSLHASFECLVALANLLNVSGITGEFKAYKDKALTDTNGEHANEN